MQFPPHVLLLLLLSRFSRVRLCAIPETAAQQAALSLGFSRQEHWSGLPFPSPMHENESEDAQSCPTLRDPMDCSLPGSSAHGIFQTRVLEWGAISFSAPCTRFHKLPHQPTSVVPYTYRSRYRVLFKLLFVHYILETISLILVTYC